MSLLKQKKFHKTERNSLSFFWPQWSSIKKYIKKVQHTPQPALKRVLYLCPFQPLVPRAPTAAVKNV